MIMTAFLETFYQNLYNVPKGQDFSAVDLCGIMLCDFTIDSLQKIIGTKVGFFKSRQLKKSRIEDYKRASFVMHQDLQTAMDEETVVERDFWEIIFGTEEYQRQKDLNNDFFEKDLKVSYTVCKDALIVNVATDINNSRGKLNFEIDEEGNSNIKKFNYVFEKKDDRQVISEKKSYNKDPSFG